MAKGKRKYNNTYLDYGFTFIKRGDEQLPLCVICFKGPFPLRAWKRAFFVSFIDLRLKRAVKIEARAKKINKTKNALFHTRSGNGP